MLKYGYNAFHRTSLTSNLLGNGRSQLVIVGTMTEVCIEDSARGAYHEGFDTIVVQDAVSSRDRELHRAALRVLATHYCRVATMDEVLDELRVAQ